MIEIIILLIVIDVLYSFVLGYREVLILCQQIAQGTIAVTSWHFRDYKSWFWFTDQNNKKVSVWDSFHVSNGIAMALYSILSSVLFVVAFGLMWYWFIPICIVRWLLMMQERNLMMHKIMHK